MKLAVKTLKGGKFEVDCQPSDSVGALKSIIVSGLIGLAFEALFESLREGFVSLLCCHYLSSRCGSMEIGSSDAYPQFHTVFFCTI